jgi:hypothetical protein
MTQVELSPNHDTSAGGEPGPELFIGVVLPLGVPWDNLTQALKTVLGGLGYGLTIIRLTDELKKVVSLDEQEEVFPKGRYQIRDAAARLSELTGNKGMAYLGVRHINHYRTSLVEAKKSTTGLVNRKAYCFQSLKRPEEVDALHDIYGKSFICIAAHLPRQVQSDSVAKTLAAKEQKANINDAKAQAETLISEDNGSGREGGENVKAASSKADVFVNVAGTRESIIGELSRFFSAIFNHPFQTPTPDEQGMAIAHLASLRSAHPQRQVGAALTTSDGSVLAVGCNEVPAPQGGLYWTGDKEDRRDFQFEKYTSLAVREEIFEDII